MADVQVNELTTVTAPTATDSVVMVNRDTNEGKIIDATMFSKNVVIVSTTISALPVNLTGLTNVTSDMVLVNWVLGTPTAMESDWTVTTGNGTVSITGTLASGETTTLVFYLARPKA